MTTYCKSIYRCSLCGKRTVIIPAGRFKFKKCVYCGHTEVLEPKRRGKRYDS